MTRATTDGLLLELLNQQVDTGDGASLGEARIRQALTAGPGFSKAESRLIWRAPLARDTVLRVKDDLCREFSCTLASFRHQSRRQIQGGCG